MGLVLRGAIKQLRQDRIAGIYFEGTSMNYDFKSIVASRGGLVAALLEADTVPLLLSLVHLAGDPGLLDEVRPLVTGPWDYSNSIPAETKDQIRGAMVKVLTGLADGSLTMPPRPDDALLSKMMNVAVGQAVSDEYRPMMLKQLGIAEPDGHPDCGALAKEATFHVAIIGAGMSGLGLAIQLKKSGIPFTIFEKNDDVGGTWLENSYPGCGVDTPNHSYSFSGEPNNEWSRFYSKQSEIWAYFRRCAEKHDLLKFIRLGTEVTGARFDETSGRWNLELRQSNGRISKFVASALVAAVGQLNRPSLPSIQGMETFQGPSFHTARWNHDVSLRRKRVAMIGTGASGMQVGPAIAEDVERLTIYQRTPHWVTPNPNYHRTVSAGKQWVLENIPFYRDWYRFQLFWGFSDGIHDALQIDPTWPHLDRSLNAINERHRQFLERHVGKELEGRPDLIEKVTPKYPPYGKRMLMDNHWYATLRRPNVELVTDAIERITETGVLMVDGSFREADLIVFATGFQPGRLLAPIEFIGREGMSIHELWANDNPRAYLGITVPKFPNLFLLYGPNTNLGHGGSAIFSSECQITYVMQCLEAMIMRGWSTMECDKDVHDAYNERVDQAHSRMVWSHGGMSNWYRNKAGRVFANSPWRLVDYWRMTSKPNFDDYKIA